MKKWIKRISIGVAVVLAIVVVGLAAFLLTFDPNAYKDRLQAWVAQRYHRTLTIDGDIEATLFPRLGVTLQGVSLSEPDSAETFASMDSARMSVAIWPLLSRNVVIDHASFAGVKARVVRDKQGRLNFQDLIGGDGSTRGGGQDAAARGQAPAGAQGPGKAGEPAPQPAPGSAGQGKAAGPAQAPGAGAGVATGGATMDIDIAGLDIKDGEIQLQDDAAGRSLTISQLSAKTGRVRVRQPFDVSLSAHVEGASPRVNADIAGQGVARIDPQAQRYEVSKLDLKAAGQLPGANARNLTARGDLAYEGGSGAIGAAGLEVVFEGEVADQKGGTASLDASLAADRLRVDPNGQAIQAAKVALRAKGTLPRGPFEFAVDAPALDISPTAASGSPMNARLRILGDNGVDVRLATADITGDFTGNNTNVSIAQVKLSADIKQAGKAWTVNAASPMKVDLGKRAGVLPALAGNVDITGPDLPGGALRIPYTGTVQGDMSAATAGLRLDAQLEGGKLALEADATHLGAKPIVKFAVEADTLDLDKLMPPQSGAARPTPAGAGKKAGPANGKEAAAASGATGASGGAGASGAAAGASGGKQAGDPAGEAVTAGAPAPAPAASAANSGEIDLSALVGPTASGTIKAGRLVARGLVMQNLSAAVKLAQGKLDVAPLTATLYNGKLAASVSLDAARENALATRFTLEGVAVGPLLADVAKRSPLTGTGSVAGNLSTRGRRVDAMRNNLGGAVQLRLRDGAIKGFDVARALRDLKQVVSGGKQDAPTDVPADASRETAFSRMDADLVLAQGVATIKRLDVASPVLQVNQGSPAVIDLPKGTIDVVANVKISDSPPAYADLRELRGVAVPVHVAGPYDALRYRIDWRAVAGDALSRALQRALGGKDADKQHNGESRQDTIRDLGRMLRGITGK